MRAFTFKLLKVVMTIHKAKTLITDPLLHRSKENIARKIAGKSPVLTSLNALPLISKIT